MASIEYQTASGEFVQLHIDPARVEMLDPNEREHGSQTKSLGDRCHENVHWRTDETLKLKLRALNDGEMYCWRAMLKNTRCGTVTLDVRPSLGWLDISYATVTREKYSYGRDGFGLWWLELTVELVEALS